MCGFTYCQGLLQNRAFVSPTTKKRKKVGDLLKEVPFSCSHEITSFLPPFATLLSTTFSECNTRLLSDVVGKVFGFTYCQGLLQKPRGAKICDRFFFFLFLKSRILLGYLIFISEMSSLTPHPIQIVLFGMGVPPPIKFPSAWPRTTRS